MSEPVLRGDLGLIGLFDLGQLLLLNGATGCLSVRHESRKAFLYFVDGRLVHAVDEDLRQGELAAYQVFAWRAGSFEFRAEAPSGATTLEGSTDSIMLEAARRLDESREGEAPGSPEQQRLRDRRAALEGLRDAFQQVAGDPLSGTPRSPLPMLAELVDPGDRLVFRPGQPTRLRRGGRWTEPDATPLAAVAYRELRSRVLEESVALLEEGRDTPVAFHFHADQGALAVNLVGAGADEALWLRRVGFVAHDTEARPASGPGLAEALARSPGIVLVGGPDLGAARAALATAVNAIAENESSTVVIASDDTTYRWPERAGVVLRVAPETLPSALRAIEPDVVVLDPAVPWRHASFSDLAPVPRIVAGAVAVDAASLPARWLARFSSSLARGVRASLATLSWTLVTPADPNDPRSVRVHPLSPGQGRLALAGRTAALARTLASGPPSAGSIVRMPGLGPQARRTGR